MKRALALHALALGALLGCTSKSEPPPAATKAPSVASAIRIAPELIASGRIAIGKVERRVPIGEQRVAGDVRTVESGKAEAGTLVAGRVATIEVAVGSHVERGAVLAWIDAPELGRAVADFLRARARAGVAAHKLERQLTLEKEDATSKNAIDDAKAESLVAQADLAAARTALATIGGSEPKAGEVGARLAVRAPIAGTITRKEAVLGAPVSPDKSLFEIVAPAEVQIVANVPETIAAPALGASAQVIARGKSEPCAAKIVGDVGVVDPTTHTRALRLAAVGPCASLVPGVFVDVSFPIVKAEGAKVETIAASDAVVEVHQAKAVFVTTDHGATFLVRSVRVGPVIGADAIIEDGLREGEEVAIAGALLLKGELLRAELAVE